MNSTVQSLPVIIFVVYSTKAIPSKPMNGFFYRLLAHKSDL